MKIFLPKYKVLALFLAISLVFAPSAGALRQVAPAQSTVNSELSASLSVDPGLEDGERTRVAPLLRAFGWAALFIGVLSMPAVYFGLRSIDTSDQARSTGSKVPGKEHIHFDRTLRGSTLNMTVFVPMEDFRPFKGQYPMGEYISFIAIGYRDDQGRKYEPLMATRDAQQDKPGYAAYNVTEDLAETRQEYLKLYMDGIVPLELRFARTDVFEAQWQRAQVVTEGMAEARMQIGPNGRLQIIYNRVQPDPNAVIPQLGPNKVFVSDHWLVFDLQQILDEHMPGASQADYDPRFFALRESRIFSPSSGKEKVLEGATPNIPPVNGDPTPWPLQTPQGVAKDPYVYRTNHFQMGGLHYLDAFELPSNGIPRSEELFPAEEQLVVVVRPRNGWDHNFSSDQHGKGATLHATAWKDGNVRHDKPLEHMPLVFSIHPQTGEITVVHNPAAGIQAEVLGEGEGAALVIPWLETVKPPDASQEDPGLEDSERTRGAAWATRLGWGMALLGLLSVPHWLNWFRQGAPGLPAANINVPVSEHAGGTQVHYTYLTYGDQYMITVFIPEADFKPLYDKYPMDHYTPFVLIGIDPAVRQTPLDEAFMAPRDAASDKPGYVAFTATEDIEEIGATYLDRDLRNMIPLELRMARPAVFDDAWNRADVVFARHSEARFGWSRIGRLQAIHNGLPPRLPVVTSALGPGQIYVDDNWLAFDFKELLQQHMPGADTKDYNIQFFVLRERPVLRDVDGKFTAVAFRIELEPLHQFNEAEAGSTFPWVPSSYQQLAAEVDDFHRRNFQDAGIHYLSAEALPMDDVQGNQETFGAEAQIVAAVVPRTEGRLFGSGKHEDGSTLVLTESRQVGEFDWERKRFAVSDQIELILSIDPLTGEYTVVHNPAEGVAGEAAGEDVEQGIVVPALDGERSPVRSDNPAFDSGASILGAERGVGLSQASPAVRFGVANMLAASRGQTSYLVGLEQSPVAQRIVDAVTSANLNAQGVLVVGPNADIGLEQGSRLQQRVPALAKRVFYVMGSLAAAEQARQTHPEIAAQIFADGVSLLPALFALPEADRTAVLSTVAFVDYLKALSAGVIAVEQVSLSDVRLIFTLLGVPQAILETATDAELSDAFELLIKA